MGERSTAPYNELMDDEQRLDQVRELGDGIRVVREGVVGDDQAAVRGHPDVELDPV